MPSEAEKCLPVLKETHFDWDPIASSGLIGVPRMNIDGYTYRNIKTERLLFHSRYPICVQLGFACVCDPCN
jgi:hypothetical protein